MRGLGRRVAEVHLFLDSFQHVPEAVGARAGQGGRADAERRHHVVLDLKHRSRGESRK